MCIRDRRRRARPARSRAASGFTRCWRSSIARASRSPRSCGLGTLAPVSYTHLLFDPDRISYRDLLEFFFQIHDPTTKDRQGNDIGSSYRSAIYYIDDEQRRVAEDTIADVDASGLWPAKVVTEVAPAGPFWEAEAEHQDYLERYPNGYTCHFVRPGWKLPRRAQEVAR